MKAAMRSVFFSTIFFCAGAASADLLCMKAKTVQKPNGKFKTTITPVITSEATCPNRHVLIADTAVFSGTDGTNGVDGDNFIVGFSNITGNDAGVRSFGGSQTTGINSQRTAAGIYTVTFVGTFDATANFNTLSPACSTTDSTDTCSAFISNVSSTEIEVGIFTRDDALGTTVDSDFMVQVLLGAAPLI